MGSDYSILENSADPDEKPHFVAIHLGHGLLQNYLFKGFQYTKG